MNGRSIDLSEVAVQSRSHSVNSFLNGKVLGPNDCPIEPAWCRNPDVGVEKFRFSWVQSDLYCIKQFKRARDFVGDKRRSGQIRHTRKFKSNFPVERRCFCDLAKVPCSFVGVWYDDFFATFLCLQWWSSRPDP